MRNIQKMLTENAVVNLWPEAGQILDVSRGKAFQGAADGSIPTVKGLGRLKKVPTAWLRRVLQIDEPAA
jgi:hypothetical protein